MLLDSGFRCERLGSNFLLQSRECDFMHTLMSVSPPPTPKPTASNSSNITVEMESTEINKQLTA